jgi:hypothetical protein
MTRIFLAGMVFGAIAAFCAVYSSNTVYSVHSRRLPTHVSMANTEPCK